MEYLRKYWNEKTAAGVMLLLLVVALLPVMVLGRFNHPTGDDYYYGATTHLIWEETGNLFAVIVAAAKGVALEYGRWQGTYAALFLMYLPPNVFGILPYRFVTAGILLLLCGGIFYLGNVILKQTLGMSKCGVTICCSAVSLLCFETVQGPGESFFWYNGSMYYTGFFAITLFFLGLAIRSMEKPTIPRSILLCLLAAILGGGNYVTLLPCMILTIGLCAWSFWKRKTGRKAVSMGSLVILLGFAVSALAPGNQVRQDGMWKIPAWKAVAKSLLQGILYLQAWIGIWWILAALLITPVLLAAMKKSRFRFESPVCVIGILYGIFCSMSCPTFYTMNSTGPARAVAAVYYGFVLFSFAAYGYLLGFLQRVVRERWEKDERPETMASVKNAGTTATAESKETTRRVGTAGQKRMVFEWLYVVVVLALVVGACVTGAASETTTAKSFRLLASGEAAAYEKEFQERLGLLQDDSLTELVLSPYEHQPEMLYVGDFSGEVDEPTNKKLAEFYGKESVRVEYE